MFVYNNKEYEKVWFTSDEHYGSNRHILLSGRLDFQDIAREKRIREFKRELDQRDDISKTIKNGMVRHFKHSEYGLTISNYLLDKMNEELIYRHNIRVDKNDLVFHLGDFGDYKYAEKLNGNHVLIMGNYDYDNCERCYCGEMNEFVDKVLSNNFIGVHQDYAIHLDNDLNIFGISFKKEVGKLFLTHKPSECSYDLENNQYIKYSENSDKIIMNLFGHIHDKGKIKRCGLNVGVDCHHYYPVSQEEVEFYLNAILHHYDNEVFC